MKYIITFWTVFILTIFGNYSCSKDQEKKCEFIDITYIDKRPDFIFICRSDNTIYFRNYFIEVKGKYSTTDCINILPENGIKIKILQVTSKSIEFIYAGKTYIHTKI